MKILKWYCITLFLFIISCSPKQELHKKYSDKHSIDKNNFNENSTIYVPEYIKSGEKVVFKGMLNNNQIPRLGLVTYNGNDVYVEMYSLYDKDVTMFYEGKAIEFDYHEYHNYDLIKIYKKCTKESEYFFSNKKEVKLHKIEGIKDWLYLSADYLGDDQYGFVYIYDISENSFYGNLEEKKKSGNFYTSLIYKEYDILRKYQNIKRYGPLLTFNYNNKIIEYWDSFCYPFKEASSKRYLVLDYYPEYNEALIRIQYYEGGEYNILNIETEEIRCAGILEPYFNESRTLMISMVSFYTEHYTLKIYSINNGFYSIIEEIKFDSVQDYDMIIKNIGWINDNEVQIDSDKSGTIIVEIGENIKINRK
jgi:hypothetical protein